MRTTHEKIRDVQEVISYVSAIRSTDDTWRRLVLEILDIYLNALQPNGYLSDRDLTGVYQEVLIARLLAKHILVELKSLCFHLIRRDFVRPQNRAELVMLILREMVVDLGRIQSEMSNFI